MSRFLHLVLKSTLHSIFLFSILLRSDAGKNATDILIAVDAMEFALTRGVKKVLIVSSDGDYRHLVRRHGHRLRCDDRTEIEPRPSR